MKQNHLQECEIVQDLLPLYYDEACTRASREFVERHLSTCESCKKTYEELKNHTVDAIIRTETSGVLERHAKKERNAAYKAGFVIALLLLIPVVVTFIVLAASGGSMGVFAVVTASMLLTAAFTAVPLMSSKKRLVRSILTGVFALILIFFFVDAMNGGGEFILWVIPTIFGLSVVLFPFVIRDITLPPVLSDKKALIAISWDTVWLFLTIFEICSHSGDVEGMRDGFIIALILMAGVWLIFLVARYLPANRWIKAGIIAITGSVWTAFSNDVYAYFAEQKKQITILLADFSNWASDKTLNANIFALILILGIAAGGLLIAAGIVKNSRKREKEKD